MAWSYDAVSWLVSLGQWRAWIEASMAYLPQRPHSPTTVLEVNHGPGHLLLSLHQRGYRVTGLDLSPYMLRKAQRRLRQNHAPVPLIQGTALQIPFRAESFDHVVSTFPAEFILFQETLQELIRVLRPGGRVVIVPQARFTGRGFRVKLLEWLYAVTGQRPEAIGEAHAHPFWRRMEAAGFSMNVEEVLLPGSVVTVVVAQKLSYNAHSRDELSLDRDRKI